MKRAGHILEVLGLGVILVGVIKTIYTNAGHVDQPFAIIAAFAILIGAILVAIGSRKPS